MKIVYCGGLNYQPTAPDHMGIKQGFSMLGWDWHVVDPILNKPSRDKVASDINNLNPDVVIHGNTDSLTECIPPLIKKSITQIFWMLDYRAPGVLISPALWDHWTKCKGHIDYIFVSSRDHMKMWNHAFNCPTYFAPHACLIPEPKSILIDKRLTVPVLFIGSRSDNLFFKNRVQLLNQIDREVRITFVNETNPDKRNHVWTMMNKYYGSAKVVLDISHFWEASGYCSGRYWYTATFGGCAVTKRFPRCEDFFPDGMKWYFDTPAQAVSLIGKLLDDDKLRIDTKVKVAKHAWKYHNYAVRFSQMFKAIETGKDQI